MYVAASFIAYGKSAKAVEPGEAAFDDPAVSAELFFAVDASASNARQHTAAATSVAAAPVIVALVGVAFFGPLLRTAGFPADSRYGVEHVFEHGAVMNIGAGQPNRERNAAPVCYQVPLRARLAAIRWIWARGGPPFLAGMHEESAQTRLKSIRFALRKRRSSSRCNVSQTPASCHSRRRRQQVTPEPQPSSGGRSSQPIPVRSTNSIPLRAARSGTRGRPPRGFDVGGGRIFSITGQRPSGIRTEGIPSYESVIPRRTRVLKGVLSAPSFLRFCLRRPSRRA